MRKTLGLLLTLALAGASAFAAPKVVILKPTIKGTPTQGVLKAQKEPHTLAKYKAQNNLSAAMNQRLIKEKQGATFLNGTIDTIPYFNSWFVTGSRNSVYTYSMVGHSPKAGGTTSLNNELIPLITQLIDASGNLAFTFDPTVANDPQGSDISLLQQSPIFDTTTTYPGNGGSLPPDTGQITDTHMRASFPTVRTADWHTPLNAPTFPQVQYTMVLSFNNGDWTLACCDQNGNNFPVVNIDSISNVFGQILALEAPANNVVPIFQTDFVTAFIPGGGCCVIGFHTAQAGIVDPNGILVWTWASFLPQSNDPFGPGFSDITAASHEIDELYNDPFVNTLVSAWVDGSVSFAQGNLETGDVIEAMASVDSIFPVTLTTTGGAYTFHPQNEASLQWFTRNPRAPANGPGPGVYSWPNTNTLNNGHNPAGWVYGEGPGGFFFGPPF